MAACLFCHNKVPFDHPVICKTGVVLAKMLKMYPGSKACGGGHFGMTSLKVIYDRLLNDRC